MSEAVYLALGANLGDRLANLREAVRRLAAIGEVEATSPVYESVPLGGLDQPSYLNAVVRVRTELEPVELMAALKAIEHEMGRTDAGRWASRLIDIDIVLYGGRVVAAEALVIPHAGLRARNFVLRPLLDIEPSATDPRDASPLSQALADIGSDGLQRQAEALI